MILDTSVAVHWFVETEFSKAAGVYRFRDDLAAPDLLLIEAANVFCRQVRAERLTSAQCLESIVVLKACVTDLAPSSQLLEAAVELALRHHHPVYDCLYLALALKRHEPLVTADRRLAQLSHNLSIPTELIEPST